MAIDRENQAAIKDDDEIVLETADLAEAEEAELLEALGAQPSVTLPPPTLRVPEEEISIDLDDPTGDFAEACLVIAQISKDSRLTALWTFDCNQAEKEGYNLDPRLWFSRQKKK